jgi:hypothetical protein
MPGGADDQAHSFGAPERAYEQRKPSRLWTGVISKSRLSVRQLAIKE